MGNGPNYSCKVGKVSQDAKKISQNVETVLGNMLGNLCCWDNIDFSRVTQISLKVGDGVDLPVYNHFSSEEIDAYM